MKAKELREKTKEELGKLLEEKRDSARRLRFDIVTKQAKNNRDLRNSKRDIARILTLIKEK
ncbi:MAG: 50S ribosomal protein L29 [Patescibacteria group bacterium]